MGASMVGCSVGAGVEVVAHDADPAAVATLPGVVGAGSARAVAERCAVIGIAVVSAEQVHAVCDGPDGLFAGAAPGTTVLVHSTIAHEPLRAVAAAGAERGVAVLDAPVSGPLGHLSVPDLCVLVGGPAAGFRAAEPLLRTFATTVVHLGGLGAGLDAKLSLNVLRYLGFLVSQEATRLAEDGGIDAATLAHLVDRSGAFRFTGDFGRDRVPEDLERRRLNVATAHKDLTAALARADELGGRLPLTSRSLDLLPSIWGVDGPPPGPTPPPSPRARPAP